MKPLRTGWKVSALIVCIFGAMWFGVWQKSPYAGMWMLCVLAVPVGIACGLTERRES